MMLIHCLPIIKISSNLNKSVFCVIRDSGLLPSFNIIFIGRHEDGHNTRKLRLIRLIYH